MKTNKITQQNKLERNKGDLPRQPLKGLILIFTIVFCVLAMYGSLYVSNKNLLNNRIPILIISNIVLIFVFFIGIRYIQNDDSNIIPEFLIGIIFGNSLSILLVTIFDENVFTFVIPMVMVFGFLIYKALE